MENPFRAEQSIFNGQFTLITEENEFKMSHWVKGFGIEDKEGNVVLDLNYSLHLNNFEEAGNVLKVNFNIYPLRSKEYDVEIDPFKRVFVYRDQKLPLEDFRNTFENIAKEV